MERKSFKNIIKSSSLVKPNLTGHQLYNSETIQGKTSTLQKTRPLQVLKSYSYIYGLQTSFGTLSDAKGKTKDIIKWEIEIIC